MDDQHRRRTSTALRLVAAAITTALAACGTAAADASQADAPPVRHVWEQVAHRNDLRRDVARMPAGWPATEAMRLEAEQPLGDAARRETWRRNVELMPPDWPATQAMHADLDR